MKCCPVGSELGVGFEYNGVQLGVIDRADVCVGDIRCCSTLEGVHGMACTPHRVVFSVLRNFLPCNVINDVSLGVVSPLPDDLCVVYEVTKLLVSVATRG